MANQTEAECLVVASEECAELTKVCMKILRFGIDDEKKSDLISEMGDVQCMIDLLGDHLDISSDQILEASTAKREKLKKWSNLIKEKEYGGPEGPEPTRYGDWEKNGICSDF